MQVLHISKNFKMKVQLISKLLFAYTSIFSKVCVKWNLSMFVLCSIFKKPTHMKILQKVHNVHILEKKSMWEWNQHSNVGWWYYLLDQNTSSQSFGMAVSSLQGGNWVLSQLNKILLSNNNLHVESEKKRVTGILNVGSSF